MDSFYLQNELNYWLAMHDSGAFIGKTIEVSGTPGVWSSLEAANQRVIVAVQDVLCGPALESPHELDMPLVQGARSAADKPGLAPWITQPGSRVIYIVGKAGIDEDLVATPASEANVAWMKALCSSPGPTGVAALLHAYAQGATNPASAAILKAAGTTVLDIEAPRGGVRLTLYKGVLRVFSGIRYDRVVGSRPPDLKIKASAADLHAVLVGKRSASALGLDASPLGPAFAENVAQLAKNPVWRAQLDRAAAAN
ncbi:MAG TPA: hypothetical protein ENJ18_02325 [Nannocystis exedens]|nr:hypothetical protein [Nannocystis exedens]